MGGHYVNSLLKTGAIRELPCGANFGYLLREDVRILPTEYKVLKRQGNGALIRCMKMTYNGQAELYYVSSGYRTLSAMVSTMTANSFLTVTANILEAILEVKNNGFLSCRNIDISFDKIFVDASTLKVYLVYLPVDKMIFSDEAVFESQLRSALVQSIQNLPGGGSSQVLQLLQDLSDTTLPLEEICARFGGTKEKGNVQAEEMRRPRVWSNTMRVVAVNAPAPVEILVNKVPFVIGKNAAAVDGAITFNHAISRVHCQITKLNGQYQIADLGSANGTFINGRRLEPNQPYLLNNGDTVRLANSDFRVYIG